MTEAFHATPGSIVEFDGSRFLVEQVRIHLIMQKIEARLPADFGVNQHYPIHSPVYQRIEGAIGDEILSRVIPLIPMEKTQ